MAPVRREADSGRGGLRGRRPAGGGARPSPLEPELRCLDSLSYGVTDGAAVLSESSALTPYWAH